MNTDLSLLPVVEAGRVAGQEGRALRDCPYSVRTEKLKALAWIGGFRYGHTLEGATPMVWTEVVEGKSIKWEELRHPRDGHGRFISIGDLVHIGGGGKGTVTDINGQGGKVGVRTTDGRHVEVSGASVTVDSAPHALHTPELSTPGSPEVSTPHLGSASTGGAGSDVPQGAPGAARKSPIEIAKKRNWKLPTGTRAELEGRLAELKVAPTPSADELVAGGMSREEAEKTAKRTAHTASVMEWRQRIKLQAAIDTLRGDVNGGGNGPPEPDPTPTPRFETVGIGELKVGDRVRVMGEVATITEIGVADDEGDTRLEYRLPNGTVEVADVPTDTVIERATEGAGPELKPPGWGPAPLPDGVREAVVGDLNIGDQVALPPQVEGGESPQGKVAGLYRGQPGTFNVVLDGADGQRTRYTLADDTAVRIVDPPPEPIAPPEPVVDPAISEAARAAAELRARRAGFVTASFQGVQDRIDEAVRQRLHGETSKVEALKLVGELKLDANVSSLLWRRENVLSDDLFGNRTDDARVMADRLQPVIRDVGLARFDQIERVLRDGEPSPGEAESDWVRRIVEDRHIPLVSYDVAANQIAVAFDQLVPAGDSNANDRLGSRPITTGTVPSGPEPTGYKDRVAYWAKALPVNRSAIGQQPEVRKTLAPFQLDAVNTGKPLQVIERTVYTPAVDSGDDGPDETALGHVEAIRKAGSALQDEITRRMEAEVGADPQTRLKALQEAVKTASSEYRAIVMLRDYDRTAAASQSAILNQLRAQASDLDQKIATARSRHTRDVLAEMRPMGPTGDTRMTYSTGERAATTKAMRWAEQNYPTEWLAQMSRAKVTLKTVGRGYHSGNTIALSKDYGQWRVDGAPPMGRVAVHEMGHHAEANINGLVAAQSLFHYSRTVNGPMGGRTRDRAYSINGRRTEIGRKDKYPEPYTGKEYGGRNYEVFTTGAESLFAGSPYLDEDLTNFMLGTLALL